MVSVSDKWGIDPSGRKIHYEPWPLGKTGEYRKPDEREIAQTYGICGEAINETLLFLEVCGGDSNRLIQLLNEHTSDRRFFIDRETLLDSNRWYTHEYYFYFIMFTKKVMDDYSWHFIKGEKIQLSKYHYSYEYGFLENVPYGERKGDASNAVPYCAITYYTKKGYNFNDLYVWVDALTWHKTDISYRDVVSKLDNYCVDSEFMGYICSLIMIILK